LATLEQCEPFVRIIRPAFLIAAARRHPTAEPSLRVWQRAVTGAEWRGLADVRATFAGADAVRVASGRMVVVFNIGGNNFRLICALHYDRRRLYTLRFLTHAEYSKNRWKDDL
jgi:mRNA interferase HigB